MAALAEPSSSLLTLAATNSQRSSTKLTTKQSSNTQWTSFSLRHSSEKAATAFQVSKTRHNSRTKHYFANPRKHDQKLLLTLILEHLQQSTHTHTNTLSYTSLAHVYRKHNKHTVVLAMILTMRAAAMSLFSRPVEFPLKMHHFLEEIN